MARKILLIEDDAFLGDIYTTKFVDAGYEMEIASNGEEGLEKAKKINPDIVLLDVVLPKVNGFEVLENLKNDSGLKSIPVVILSNLGSENDIKKGLNLGAADYLVKSQYTPSEIVDKIEEILRN